MKLLTNKRLIMVALGICVLVVGLLSSVASAQAGGTAYTVLPNDTLGSIAQAHGVTVQSILDSNPAITDPDRIFAGQQIMIPPANLAAGENIWGGFSSGTSTPGTAGVPVTGGTQVSGAQTGPTTYTVKTGDTLGSIAQTFQVTVESLLAANPSITDPNQIFSGQQLAIPAPDLQAGQSIWTGFPAGTPAASGVPVTGGTTLPTPAEPTGTPVPTSAPTGF